MVINNSIKVPANRGWQWINQGTRYFFLAKINWLLTVFIIAVASVALIKMPAMFQLALVFILPFVSAGLAIACFEIEQGKSMSIEYLIKGFQSANKFNLFRYGMLFMLMMIISQVISSILLTLIGVNSEQLMQAMELLKSNQESPVSAVMSSSVLTKFFLVSIVSLLPLLVINILSPIILVFSEYTAFTAIKLSFGAAIKNIAAFVVYGLVYLAMILFVVFVLQFLISILFALFGENSSIALIIYSIAFITCILSITALSYCSAFVAFKELFTGEQT